jgi:hypothetical protein
MAAIDANMPEFGWAGYEHNHTLFNSHLVGTSLQRAFLIRFPLDRVPQGHRIVNAELVVPVRGETPADMRLFVWRLTADWGAGVCHLYRLVRPQKAEWSAPGARGTGVDRAPEPTRVVTVTGSGTREMVINVTRDVELWYTGTANNYGWLFTSEEPGMYVHFDSPTYAGRERWRLRITYEPK